MPVSTLNASASSHGWDTQKAGLEKTKTTNYHFVILNNYLESGLMSQQAIAIAINCFGQSLVQYFWLNKCTFKPKSSVRGK
jgi:hypothetical protein